MARPLPWGQGPRSRRWLVPCLGARSRVCIYGSSPLLGPGAAYASMAHSLSWGPEPRMRRWLVPSSGPGALSATNANPALAGPWPPRPLWLVPCATGPGPPRPNWLVPSTGPGAVRRPATFALGPWSPCVWPLFLATFALGEVPMTGRPLLRGAATPLRLVPHSWGPEPCQGPATFALGT